MTSCPAPLCLSTSFWELHSGEYLHLILLAPCTVLFCTVLYCTIQFNTVLYCRVRYSVAVFGSDVVVRLYT